MSSNVDVRHVLSVSEFARAAGISERLVRNAINRGELYATKLMNRWLIPADELTRLTQVAAIPESSGPQKHITITEHIHEKHAPDH
jgi:hypothetical protein